MALSFPTTLLNARQDAITTFAGNGCKLRIYDGVRPATGAAITTQVKLAELTLGTPFAAASVGGLLTLNPITSDLSADASGTGTWFRVVKSDLVTFVMDGNLAISGGDLNATTTNFQAGALVQCTSWTIMDPNG